MAERKVKKADAGIVRIVQRVEQALRCVGGSEKKLGFIAGKAYAVLLVSRFRVDVENNFGGFERRYVAANFLVTQFFQQTNKSFRFFHVLHDSYGVKFTERKEWHYDPVLFRLADTQIALGIYAEYTKMHSANPPPRFFEVDRRSTKIDHLWHIPLEDRTVFSRQIDNMPVILQKERPDWRLTRIGLTPQQKHKVWMANLLLQKADWFPNRGDLMFFDGYRHMIVNVVLEPNAYWQQTNVWLGLVCETIIPADGDARPLIDQSVAVPRELIQSRPLPEI